MIIFDKHENHVFRKINNAVTQIVKGILKKNH